jgi:hypothetical protein
MAGRGQRRTGMAGDDKRPPRPAVPDDFDCCRGGPAHIMLRPNGAEYSTGPAYQSLSRSVVMGEGPLFPGTSGAGTGSVDRSSLRFNECDASTNRTSNKRGYCQSKGTKNRPKP